MAPPLREVGYKSFRARWKIGVGCARFLSKYCEGVEPVTMIFAQNYSTVAGSGRP